VPRILVDADSCPVKEETYRVAKRYGLDVVLVSAQWLRAPPEPWLSLEVVKDEGQLDAADDRIVDVAEPGDIVVTEDILLAGRCLEEGAEWLSAGAVDVGEGQNALGVGLEEASVSGEDSVLTSRALKAQDLDPGAGTGQTRSVGQDRDRGGRVQARGSVRLGSLLQDRLVGVWSTVDALEEGYPSFRCEGLCEITPHGADLGQSDAFGGGTPGVCSDRGHDELRGAGRHGRLGV